MRAREEQIAEIETFCGHLSASGHVPTAETITGWLIEAEQRGFERYQSKKLDHTAIDCSASVKQWQHDQKEYFDPVIIEIVEEYAAWRDMQEAECAADTRRLEWLEKLPFADVRRLPNGWEICINNVRHWDMQPTLRRAIDAAMEGGNG